MNNYIDSIKDELYNLYCQLIDSRNDFTEEQKQIMKTYFLNKLNLI